MTRKRTEVQVATEAEVIPHWDFFFKCQRSPILRSQLLTALMAGTPLEIDRVPRAALLDALLLATVSRQYHEAEIVDDYQGLVRRADESWRDPQFTHATMDQIHGGTISFLCYGYDIDLTTVETNYIAGMVGSVLRSEPPVYFSKEL